MIYEYVPALESDNTFYNSVFNLLKTTEEEFIPPLHTRCSTTQKNLTTVQYTEEEKEKNRKLQAQLNRDYSNSSKPSSMSPNHNKITNNREKTDRKPGGQSGHKGYGRKRRTPDRV